MKRFFTVVVAFLSFFASAVLAEPLSNEEEITNYHAVIEPQRDGSIIVSEFITVNCLYQNIKRGIFRDLPEKDGVTYKVLSVRRDGRPEPFFTEKKEGISVLTREPTPFYRNADFILMKSDTKPMMSSAALTTLTKCIGT